VLPPIQTLQPSGNFVSSSLKDLLGKKVDVHVHGDITKVSTADLLKELERRGDLPKPTVTNVLPAIPQGYVLEQVNGLVTIHPHKTIEVRLEKDLSKPKRKAKAKGRRK
jgi:hypothetical protein